MDRRLHADRLGDAADRRTVASRPSGARSRLPVASLPAGAMVLLDGVPWLVTGDALRRWTPGGYAERRVARGRAPVLTPASVVAVLAAGYSVAPLRPIPCPAGGDC